MYRALMKFRDLEDGHVYEAGERFPYDGRPIKEERIEALKQRQKWFKTAAIEEVEENIKAAAKPRRKAVKTQKKG